MVEEYILQLKQSIISWFCVNLCNNPVLPFLIYCQGRTSKCETDLLQVVYPSCRTDFWNPTLWLGAQSLHTPRTYKKSNTGVCLNIFIQNDSCRNTLLGHISNCKCPVPLLTGVRCKPCSLSQNLLNVSASSEGRKRSPKIYSLPSQGHPCTCFFSVWKNTSQSFLSSTWFLERQRSGT